MEQLIREIIWPKGIFGKLGRVVGALSVLALIQYAFDYGFAATVMVLVEYYDNLVDALLGWATPYMDVFVVWVNSHLDFDLQLLGYWKHIFVLLGIYFFRAAAVNYSYGYPITATFGLILGFIVALGTSVAIGAWPIIGSSNVTNLLAAVIPITGIFIFDLIKQVWNATFIRAQAAEVYQREKWTWWEFFRPNLYLVISQALGSVLLVWMVLLIPWTQKMKSPPIFALGMLIVALALYRVGIGAYEVKELRKEGESWLSTFLRTNSAGIASAMFGLFFWVFIFILTSAGLRFYGL